MLQCALNTYRDTHTDTRVHTNSAADTTDTLKVAVSAATHLKLSQMQKSRSPLAQTANVSRIWHLPWLATTTTMETHPTQLDLEQHRRLHWRQILVVNCSICVHKLHPTSVHSSLFDLHSHTLDWFVANCGWVFLFSMHINQRQHHFHIMHNSDKRQAAGERATEATAKWVKRWFLPPTSLATLLPLQPIR